MEPYKYLLPNILKNVPFLGLFQSIAVSRGVSSYTPVNSYSAPKIITFETSGGFYGPASRQDLAGTPITAPTNEKPIEVITNPVPLPIPTGMPAVDIINQITTEERNKLQNKTGATA